MKPWVISLLAGLSTTSIVLAQEPARPLRPPNIPNARGTDAGQGPPCDQITTYGQVQPPGPAATAYGARSPTPGPAPPLPTYLAPASPRAQAADIATAIRLANQLEE